MTSLYCRFSAGFYVFCLTLSFSNFFSFAQESGCTYIYEVAETENLKLAEQHIKPYVGRRFTVKDDKYTYYVGICTTPMKNGEESGAVNSDGTVGDSKIPYTDTGIIQWDGESYKVLGKFNNATAIAGTSWNLLEYREGEKRNHCGAEHRVSKIMFQCGKSTEPVFSFVMENHEKDVECYYLFELSASRYCDLITSSTSSTGLSTGSILLIVFLAVIAVYVILGFLYQRIVKGARGMEQFPNINMWRNFGNLIADGCNFVFRTSPTYESPEYRSAPTNDGPDSPHLPSDDASIDERLLTM